MVRILNYIKENWVAFLLMFIMTVTFASQLLTKYLRNEWGDHVAREMLTDPLVVLIGLLTGLVFFGSISILFFKNDRSVKTMITEIIEERDRYKAQIERSDYVIIDFPEKYRGLFQDMLRGFEDYCALKGCHIKISIDNSYRDKIGFKINAITDSIPQNTLQDLYEKYIDDLNKDEKFRDINPSSIEDTIHLMQLQNRVNLLENDKRNMEGLINVQQNFIAVLANPNFKAHQLQNYIVVSDKGSIAPLIQNASHGGLAVNGNQNKINHRVKISHSFNTKQNQISKIEEILGKLKSQEDSNKEQIHHLNELITNLHQVKGSLSEDEQPEPDRIASWLDKVKLNAERLVLTHDVTESITWLLESFEHVSEAAQKYF